MQKREFDIIIRKLSLNCAVLPSDEQMAARLPDLWEDVCEMASERFARGCRLVARRPDFKFFPTNGELLGAIAEGDAVSGAGGEGLSPMDTDQRRRVDDPDFRRQMREESERAAKEYFASPEHKTLLATITRLEKEEAAKRRAEVKPGTFPGIVLRRKRKGKQTSAGSKTLLM